MALDVLRNIASSLGQRLFPEDGAGHMDLRTLAIMTLALLCATAPLELSQLAFALVGAAAYALLQTLQISTPARGAKAASHSGRLAAGEAALQASGGAAARPRTLAGRQAPVVTGLRRPSAAFGRQPREQGPLAKQDHRTPSSQPLTPPSFASDDWDEQVEELLSQITPTNEGDRIVAQLARVVKQALRRIIPEVEVNGYASGDLVRGTAFGVAVPEVDIVVCVSPHVLAARLQGRLAPRSSTAVQLDVRKLLKSAIRACTDRLVSNGGFKFRRSAFRGQEPKVTLLAPSSLGIYSEAIPIDFSVNSTTPLYNAALLTECGQMEPRAKLLILLVKRWAKDRGVCHAAKGHLSPFSWTLLTIYFLQVGVLDEGPLLPPLEGFELSSGLAGQPMAVTTALTRQRMAGTASGRQKWVPPAGNVPRKSVAALFADFVHFYSRLFDWRNEAVSVRLGERAPPDLTLPLHIIVHDDSSTTEVGPSIEDPFEQRRNLGECTTAASLARMREELARAEDCCSRNASLTELLEPWVPPERGVTEHAACEEEGETADGPQAPAQAPTPLHPWRAATAAARNGGTCGSALPSQP
mmetsp:Transcript_87931/g.273194  ORF Transcript_87931/g.273194 Transcript_87931/m.273194 type:complete len:583 (-) Transcript_87931:255-2003(-)